MKKKSFIGAFLLFAFCLGAMAQDPVTLTFTGRNQQNQWLPLSRVSVENLTKSWQEMLFYPDTTYKTSGVGIDEYLQNENIHLLQNIPNPFNGITDFSLQLNESQKIALEMYDMAGKLVAQYDNTLPQGLHLFRATLSSPQTYLLSAKTEKERLHIKMVNTGNGGANNIEYVGEGGTVHFKLASDSKHRSSYPFTPGDQMRYIGFVSIGDTEFVSDTLVKTQTESENIILSFTLPLPVVSTTSITGITETAAQGGGNITSDSGNEITARGVCWSTNPNPTTSDNHTTDGCGTGDFSSNLTGLAPDSTYYVRAYATNSMGTAYGNQVTFTTLTFICGNSTIADYDNNIYQTVQIGNQCWMKHNLKTTHYSDGTPIALGNNGSYSTAYRYNPNDNSNNVSTYGYLYNWKAVMRNSASSTSNPSGVQGICPPNWHVPSDPEWVQLLNYINSQSDLLCDPYSNPATNAKALAATTGWENSNSTCCVGNNPSANNATDFSAFPAGYFNEFATDCHPWFDFGIKASFWTTTQYLSNNYAINYAIIYYLTAVDTHLDKKNIGMSVRCLKD